MKIGNFWTLLSSQLTIIRIFPLLWNWNIVPGPGLYPSIVGHSHTVENIENYEQESLWPAIISISSGAVQGRAAAYQDTSLLAMVQIRTRIHTRYAAQSLQ